MKKGIWIFLFYVFFILPFFSLPAFAGTEQMTLTTFYPAPFGAYDRVRLVPRGNTPSPCDSGTLYVLDQGGGNFELQMCGGGGSPAALGVWTQNANSIYPKDGATPNVGIGNTSPDPTKKLHVTGNTLLEGTLDVTSNTTLNGNLGVGKSAARTLDVEGDAQVNKLYLKADGSNVGELKVEFNSGAYYATYAP